MDPIWIGIAFVFGFAVRMLGLPPLVGYLVAGFTLNYMGIEGSEWLEVISDLGILLLLFSIGLKLNIRSLIQKEVWAGASIHIVISTLLFGLILLLLSLIGFSFLEGVNFTQALTISFGLSFSSTVFAVKILEEKGMMNAVHGKVTIGILIIQDIFAVIFLTFTSGRLPSPWALALLLLLLIPALIRIKPISFLIDKAGHGELLVLLGILLPVLSAAIFKTVGLKPDLGALVLGILLANHKKSKEISNTLLNFKDLFLVGFFLTIGLQASISWETIGIASLMAMILPLKVLLFFFILIQFKLRARTALFTSLSLGNYSEFGLIVLVASTNAGWLPGSWTTILAIALSISFIIGSTVHYFGERIFIRWSNRIKKYEHAERLPHEDFLSFRNVNTIVLGMGRVGTAVYEELVKDNPGKVMGIDYNKVVTDRHIRLGRSVIHGSATDFEFWQRIQEPADLSLAVLAMENHATHLQVISILQKHYPNLKIAGLCRFDDEIIELKKLNVDIVFNLYSEAGRGYADHINNEMSRILKLAKAAQKSEQLA